MGMRMRMRRMKNSLMNLSSKRFQSTGNVANVSNSLDLDFVLNLLDHSAKTNSSSTSSTLSTSTWMPRIKFKVIEESRNNENDRNANIKEESASSFIEKKNDFNHLFNFSSLIEFNGLKKEFDTDSSSSLTTSSNTLIRLQSLADSLPSQIYDRNGNLMPLNTSQPPMNFFDLDSTASNKLNTSNTYSTSTLPIFHRENVDWSQINLTSILKKIVPEEVFKTHHAITDNNNTEDTSKSTSANTLTNTCDQSINPNALEFTQFELKLLDKDQLHSLAKHFNIPSDQTDYKIESAILSNRKETEKRINSINNSMSKEKISWTEENENLLMKLYEELRIEKSKVDQKLLSILSKNTSAAATSTSSLPNAPSLKRGNGASDRGLWAVLGDRMRHSSNFHVSVTDCRNKVIILKRLKARD